VTTAPPSGGLDVFATLRAHPEWYFRTGRFEAPEMLALLASEATALGATDVHVRHVAGWWTLAATTDWLGGRTDAFTALASDPALGPNTTYVEVLLTAFCPDVWTATGGTAAPVTAGTDLPDGVRAVLTDPAYGRVVAFRQG
jgi:hypothetical protein